MGPGKDPWSWKTPHQDLLQVEQSQWRRRPSNHVAHHLHEKPWQGGLPVPEQECGGFESGCSCHEGAVLAKPVTNKIHSAKPCNAHGEVHTTAVRRELRTHDPGWKTHGEPRLGGKHSPPSKPRQEVQPWLHPGRLVQ